MDQEEIIPLSSYLDLARTRRAIRAFHTDNYSNDVLREILGAANNAPSAAGVQPWEFIIIRDEKIQRELSDIYRSETRWKMRLDPTMAVAGNSREFIKCPATVCIVGDRRYKRLWPQAADGPVDYREKLFQQSLAACIMSLHLAGVSSGLGTTWISSRGPTQNRLRELLDLPEWYHVGSSAPLGYPDLENAPEAKKRSSIQEKIHEDEFDADRIPTYEDLMAQKKEDPELFEPDEENSRKQKWNNEISCKQVSDLMTAWRTTERYLSDLVPSDVLESVLSAANWAPSANNSQPWEFIVVQDQDRMDAISQIAAGDCKYKHEADPRYERDQTVDLVNVPKEAFDSAPVHLVVAGNRHKEKLWPQVPDQSREKLFRHSMAACITSLTYAARAAGLGTSWLTPSGYGQQKLRQLIDLFDIPSWYYIECVTPIGYPDPDHDPVRDDGDPVNEKIHWDGLNRERIPDSSNITIK